MLCQFFQHCGQQCVQILSQTGKFLLLCLFDVYSGSHIDYTVQLRGNFLGSTSSKLILFMSRYA